jgi:hypothetical protein
MVLKTPVWREKTGTGLNTVQGMTAGGLFFASDLMTQSDA